MKKLLFLLCIYSSMFGQDSSSIFKKELNFSLGEQLIFIETDDSPFLPGLSVVRPSIDLSFPGKYRKRCFFGLSVDYMLRYFNSVSFAHKDYHYSNMFIHNLTLTGHLSRKFLRKKENHFFEVGAFYSMDIWRQKSGERYHPMFSEFDIFKKEEGFLSNSIGVMVAFGSIRKKLALKPEIQLGILNFYRIGIGDWIDDEPYILFKLNISHLW